LKLAAIDIGSNAARLLISDVIINASGKQDFLKIILVRVPLRLGFDVFETGRISDKKIDMMIKTIRSYKLLLDVYEVPYLKACATSAMRDAVNANEIIDKIKDETGIDIKVISGQEEATFIYENHIADYMSTEETYLYIDVGGGSTELTFFTDGKLAAKESFNIGTIRLLKNQVDEKSWDKMKDFIKAKTSRYHHITAIGSGGNINKVFSMSKRKDGKPLSLNLLKDYYKNMNDLSVLQRMSLYKLREDRADVIVPALSIYINVMRWADAEEIYVPKIGLSDGLIHTLYNEVKKQERSKKKL
jgi:exopolyphosphatase / guanosine-5'-triphosphate,3'-diphosphate pyrophosphatase